MRSSELPKIALCGQWESAPGESSEAAQRGTRIDKYMRHMWETGEVPSGDDEEIKLAHWANCQLLALSKGRGDVKTDEASCRIYIPVIKYVGTMDAVSVRGRWLADLKSGQRHNYREQMAAYALGCMTEHMETQWTAHLLFCDQKEVISETFTFSEARAIVQAAVDNVGKPPKLNEYCGWCAKSLTCPARVDANWKALTETASGMPVEQDAGFLAMLADPERLGLFLTRAKVFDDFREAAEAKARELLAAGEHVPGWRLQKPRVSEFVDAGHVVTAVRSGVLFSSDVIEAMGSISARKARELWSAAGAVFPEEIVNTKTGAAPLVACKTK